jgi:cytochrome c peroxidase
MHEGRFKDLAEVVNFYSTLEGAVQLDHHQEMVLSPLELAPEEQAALVAFLESLDGRLLEPAFGTNPSS